MKICSSDSSLWSTYNTFWQKAQIQHLITQLASSLFSTHQVRQWRCTIFVLRISGETRFHVSGCSSSVVSNISAFSLPDLSKQDCLVPARGPHSYTQAQAWHSQNVSMCIDISKPNSDLWQGNSLSSSSSLPLFLSTTCLPFSLDTVTAHLASYYHIPMLSDFLFCIKTSKTCHDFSQFFGRTGLNSDPTSPKAWYAWFQRAVCGAWSSWLLAEGNKLEGKVVSPTDVISTFNGLIWFIYVYMYTEIACCCIEVCRKA